jgi:peptidoglycan hydrolase-like protein with peptidoglycan-binding domain
MSYEDRKDSLASKSVEADRSTARHSPGKRTLTMSSSPRPAGGLGPVQQRADSAALVPDHEQAALTEQWMNIAMRPDLHDAPVQRKSSRTAGHEKSSMDAEHQTKDASSRFQGDNALKGIYDGKETLAKGDKGIKVVKMQQALIDMGYKLPKFGVDGKFGDETLAALMAYQKDAKVPESGKFDKATIEKMNDRFDTRSDYVKAADDFDKADPNADTRTLPSDQKKAALDALKPQPSAPGAKFDKKDEKKYGDAIKARLSKMIPTLHKQLYADKKPLRADPKKNFHKDKALEDAANAAWKPQTRSMAI